MTHTFSHSGRRIRRVNRMFQFAVVGMSLSCLLGMTPSFNEAIQWATMNFTTEGSADWNIQWSGPSSKKLKYSDVRIYSPILELSKPAPGDMTLSFGVRSDRPLSFDPLLGSFAAKFKKGDLQPFAIESRNVGTSANVIPDGAPKKETRGFWLGCTHVGHVRGNEGQDDDSDAWVYLEHEDLVIRSGPPVRFVGHDQSPRHQVRCIEN